MLQASVGGGFSWSTMHVFKDTYFSLELCLGCFCGLSFVLLRKFVDV